MGFQKKAHTVAALRPDIAVIPECGKTSVSSLEEYGYKGVWVGSNPHKGLAAFVREPLRPHLLCKPQHKWVAVLDIEGLKRPLRLIAVWACKVGDKKCDNYIGQVYRAFNENPKWLSGPETIVAGDFNSNTIWDDARPLGNHTAVVKLLEERDMVSAYHTFFRERQGEETRHTLYLRKDRQNPFHIDYIFLPNTLARRLKKVSIGTHAKWAGLSDHRPIVVDC